MRWIRVSRDDEVARLLEVEHAEELSEFSAFAEDLRTAFPDPRVEESVQHSHLAAMAEAACPDATATGSTSAVHGATPPSRPPTPRRTPLFKSLAAKITAVVVVVFASLGGLATAGALPRTVQHGVARVADTVGLNLPDPDEQEDQSGDESEPNDESGDQSEPNDESGDQQGTSADNNDQGDDNNDQGDQGTSGDSTERSDDQGTSVDSNDQGEDNNDQGDQGTSSDSSDQGGDQGDDQGGD